MGAEEGWWEGAGSEIDFMPESDTAPRKDNMCVCVCVSKSPVWILWDTQWQTERGWDRKGEGPTCIKESGSACEKAWCYFAVDISSRPRPQMRWFVLRRLFLTPKLHVCWTIFSSNLKLFSPVLICVWLNQECVSTNTDKNELKGLYSRLLSIISPEKTSEFCHMRRHPTTSTQGWRHIHVSWFQTWTPSLHTVRLTLKTAPAFSHIASVFKPLSSTSLFWSFVLCCLPLLFVPL